MHVLAVVVGTSLALVGVQPHPDQQWVAVEDVRIGQAIGGGEYVLERVNDLELDSRGNVLVLQARQHSIVVFDSRGRFVRQLGGSGGGPGEFLLPISMGSRNDTVWVRDMAKGSLTVFDGDGDLVTVYTVSIPPKMPGQTRSPPVSLLAGEALLVETLTDDVAAADGVVWYKNLLRVDPDGNVRDTIARLSVAKEKFILRKASVTIVNDQPFGDDPLWAATQDGRGVYVIERRAARDAKPDSYRVFTLGMSGDTLAAWAFSYDPEPLEEGEVDAVVRAWTEYALEAVPQLFRTRSEGDRAFREAFYLPDFKPPVTAFIVGRQGSLWLRREQNPHLDAVDWDVVGSSGQRLGKVALPAELEVVAADGRFVWGVVRDELDVPYVVRHTLR